MDNHLGADDKVIFELFLIVTVSTYHYFKLNSVFTYTNKSGFFQLLLLVLGTEGQPLQIMSAVCAWCKNHKKNRCVSYQNTNRHHIHSSRYLTTRRKKT